MTRREVAWRLFAGEYNQADHEVKEEGERSPSYVITPLGSRVNRLYVVGVLTSNEDIGTEDPFWRAQVTDPTGVFHVYAGQYQPEAAQALSELTPPTIVAVVGKSRTYSPEEGTVYTSIQPEMVKEVEVADRDRWTLQTAEHMKKRLEAVKRALELDEVTPEALEAADVDPMLREGLPEAFEHYGRPALERYVEMTRDALETLIPGSADIRSDFSPATTWEDREETDDAADAEPSELSGEDVGEDTPEPTETEDRILELCEELEDDKGAPWEEIVAQAAEDGITEEEVEEALNGLMDRGLVYEPVLGRLKTT